MLGGGKGKPNEYSIRVDCPDSDINGNFKVATVHRFTGAASSNARLIAAAPEMLAALKGLVAYVEEYQRINSLGGENNHALVTARTTIAKAQRPLLT
jgi:hypothetical protein